MQVDQSVKNAYYLSGRRTLVRLSCRPPVPPREWGWHERTAVQSDGPATRKLRGFSTLYATPYFCNTVFSTIKKLISFESLKKFQSRL